ncbi:hypothetical protein AB0I60_00565 [Actinosynnema sp. NPDC050436]|uniref:hypothetical protein n=1 Tax=Actinosynnema sp. NPDC050436 TaxID=3155659 RepID=UPI003409596C
MADAARIIEENQARLPVREQLDSNDFLAAARAGEVETAQLQRLVTGEFLILDAEIYKFGSMVVRYRHEVPAALFANLAVLYLAQRRLLADSVVGDVGLDTQRLRDSEMEPAVLDFSLAETWAAVHAGPAEVALGVHTDFQLYAPVARELVDALGKLDTVPASLVTFLENYSEEPAELTGRLAEVVDYGLADGEPEQRVTRAAGTIPDLLTGYWRYVAG